MGNVNRNRKEKRPSQKVICLVGFLTGTLLENNKNLDKAIICCPYGSFISMAAFTLKTEIFLSLNQPIFKNEKDVYRRHEAEIRRKLRNI